ncbi:hypothetical protein MY10362_004023 [Beauveria mimosiformis]
MRSAHSTLCFRRNGFSRNVLVVTFTSQAPNRIFSTRDILLTRSSSAARSRLATAKTPNLQVDYPYNTNSPALTSRAHVSTRTQAGGREPLNLKQFRRICATRYVFEFTTGPRKTPRLDPAETEVTESTRSDEDGSIFRKRKLIDAVSTRSGQGPSVAPEPAIVKKKVASKKKPRTITGLATAAYKLASQPDPGPEEENQSRASIAEAQVATTTATNAPAKKTRKRTSKAPKKTRKKEPPPKPILLSPSAALRQVANQDFLFGTSSQLAQEQSPGFLRDLARAMKHSNEIDHVSLSTPINSDAIEPPEARRSLWDAAARDEAGDVFDVDIQELAQKSQDLPSLEAQADPFGYVKEASPPREDSFLSLSDALKPQELLDEKNQTPEPPTRESCSQDAGPMPPVPTSPNLPPRPKFELYTDAQLASAVSSYGFKNVRQRGARIALLDKCWQGRNQNGAISGARSASTLAGQSTRSPVKSGRAKSPVKTPARPESSLVSASQPQEPPPSAQQPISPPKRPRGRPRKSPAPAPSLMESASLCAAALLHPGSTTLAPSTPKRPKAKSSKLVVEIPDSESDADGLDSVSASPSSVPDEMPSPSQGVDLSLSMDQDAELSIAVTSEKPASFEYITKSVTSAPRSRDVSQPSWHEKILLYDPIILEDLTAWLNCGPLTKAGYDDEVSSGEVKKCTPSVAARRLITTTTSITTFSTSNLPITAVSVHRARQYSPRPHQQRRRFSGPTTFPDAAAAAAARKPPKMAKNGELAVPRPSASVVLLSPSNEILLLHRVKTSTSFASAHVFPGGNVDPFHDGDVPPEGNPDKHRDGPAYRLCAIRETFEESGILLAKKDGKLVQLPEKEREDARKQIHARKIKFGDWLASIGATADTESLIPYTRWVTPVTVPKRFTTQMYLYLLPLTRRDVPSKMVIPTPDGGIEHTAALFAEPQAWIKQANRGEVMLFPPQYFILDTVGRHVGGGKPGALEEESKRFMQQRRRLLQFVKQVPTATTALGRAHPSSQVAWADKVISPLPLYMRESDGRAVLSLCYPGPELEGAEGDRVGDFEHVVLTKFGKKGPTGVEVRLREEVLDEDAQPKEGRLEKL